MNLPDITYGLEPAVLICADGDAAVDRCRRTIEAVGARVGGIFGIAEAAEQLPDGAIAGAVLVDLHDDLGRPVDALLSRLDRAAADGTFASVVSLPPAMIDVAIAGAPHADVTLLCDAQRFEAVAALGLALQAQGSVMLRERGDEPPLQLRQLSEEVGRIARALAELSTPEVRIEAPVRLDPALAASGEGQVTAPMLRALIRARRLREQYFHHELFADPAWDMLLDLMLARLEGRAVAVSSLCIAAAVPATTALRWIKRLTDEGIFVRTADPRDGRRVFIDLSEESAARMNAYLLARDRLRASPC